MATIKRLVETKELKTSRLLEALERGQVLWLDYEEISDILTLMIESPAIETVVHYIDGNVALLYEPETLEVLGLQVEDFETSFMPEHEQVAATWRLSDSGKELVDVADLMLVVERKKKDVARELRSVTNDLLAQRGALQPA